MYNTCTIQELKANYELNIITIFISLALVTSLPSLMYRLIQPFTCEALLSHGPEMLHENFLHFTQSYAKEF